MKENKFLNVRFLPLLLLVMVVLIAAGFWFVSPVAAQDGTGDEPSNAACLACHAEASTPMELPNGELLSIQISVDSFGNSVHGRNEVSCVTCHTDISGFPHPENTAATLKEYQLQYLDTCAECHEEQASQTQDSIHGMLLAAGNENAPTCMDCHNPHTQPPIEEVSKVNFAQVCAQCHNGIYEEYTTSVHGAALLEGNQDVPGCVDCHGVHSIADPTTAEFRNSSIYMCANCHTDESIMGKYDLSTAVLDTYVADFHGTTVTIFEETEPGQLTNKAVCYDCHGIHNILSVTDPNKGIAVKENMLLACQKCHPDATTNFPDSWLSHYRPDREKFPIVYYVDLFYKIFIPVVLGGMAIFVLSDIYFRIRSRFQKPAAESVSESKDVEKE
jgi:predicted CXXCH cytochrome family protein